MRVVYSDPRWAVNDAGVLDPVGQVCLATEATAHVLFVGERGVEERAPELRLETVLPDERRDDVVAALRRSHPYEEPAFDIYALL